MKDGSTQPRVVDGRKHDFFIVDNPVIDQKIEQIEAKRRADAGWVYAILCRLANNETGEATLRIEYLEKKTGRSKPVVIEALKALKGAGLLGVTKNREGGRQGASTYTILAVTRVKHDNAEPEIQSKEDVVPELTDLTASNKTLSPKTDTSKDVDDKPSPGTFVGYLREEIDGADIPLLRNREDRYGQEFKKHLAKGIGDDLLYKAADRIVERWREGDDHRKLTVEQALEDVVNGKPPSHARQPSGTAPKSGGTPPDVIEYVFANTRNRTILDGEQRIRSAMESFDFTSGESPPYPVQKKLGGDDSEAWAVLEGIRTLCRRAEKDAA